jgi:hypothetical protein
MMHTVIKIFKVIKIIKKSISSYLSYLGKEGSRIRHEATPVLKLILPV